ncbi:MAG: acylneuraminate cytidylyltransferase family protein [Candidatus Adiutrix sp.]|jgi:CMP-N-acetylneuraminic acid synthetase|nr:acylneuraminate cytidylyltransferase family protein [Candidatus Adiutrix sp.]
MTFLGIIPARGGSKGVPRKNIRPMGGHPLIAWTIRAALAARLLDRLVVSTEDQEIAAISRLYGAEVLERPVELAGDAALSREVIAHALAATGADRSVLLQATSPVRSPGLVDRVITAFKNGLWDSMATGFEQLLYPPHGVEHRRQDIKSVFVNDGSVIVSTRETVLAQSLFGRRAGALVTSREENVDIDDEFDFWLAEKVLERALSQGWDIEPRRVNR